MIDLDQERADSRARQAQKLAALGVPLPKPVAVTEDKKGFGRHWDCRGRAKWATCACGEQFVKQPTKNGRPSTKCLACRGNTGITNKTDRAKARHKLVRQARSQGMAPPPITRPCAKCGTVFEQASRKGRPNYYCIGCRHEEQARGNRGARKEAGA